MGDPSSPKDRERGAAAGRGPPDGGSGVKLRGDIKSGADTTSGDNNTRTARTPRNNVSDTSAGSNGTAGYGGREDGDSFASQECQAGSIPPSPRQDQLVSSPKMKGKTTLAALPSLRGLKYLDSNDTRVVMTPRTAGYIRRMARESLLSGSTTARSGQTTTTVVEDLPEPTKSEATVEEDKKKTEVEVVHPVKQEEPAAQPAAQPTARVRRPPWIGPPYTAVHTPPYTPQTWEYGRIENLLHPALQPNPLSWKEHYAVMNDLERLGPHQVLSVTGQPHHDQYPHRAPAAGSYLEDYAVPPPQGGHSFEKDPLMRSVLTPEDNLPYMREQATYQGQPLTYLHNDWMLDNVMSQCRFSVIRSRDGSSSVNSNRVVLLEGAPLNFLTTAYFLPRTTLAHEYCPGTVPTYIDIPNFGRVQGVLMRQPDGTAYPLVTLPKMTPSDILKVLDKMKNRKPTRRPWYSMLCCGV